MRILWSLAGLLVVLAVVALLARQQLAPLAAGTAAPGQAASAPANAASYSRQVQQQYRQALEGALQTPRPTGDEAQ